MRKPLKRKQNFHITCPLIKSLAKQKNKSPKIGDFINSYFLIMFMQNVGQSFGSMLAGITITFLEFIAILVNP